MTSCVSCSTPSPEEYEFCFACGWPRRQPSPYGNDSKILPVTAWTEAPARDPAGRPLAYDLDPRSGRAYIPGDNPLALDKIPDYPTEEGLGNRRSAEIQADCPPIEGVYAETEIPLAVAFGAGRLLWTDGAELFVWNLTEPRIERKSLASFRLIPGKDSLLAQGWKTFLRTEQGILVHDGLSGAITLFSDQKASSVAIWHKSIVAATGNEITHYKNGEQNRFQLPFEPISIVGSEGHLVAFGRAGESALFTGGAWKLLLKAEQNADWVQAWVVNGHIGFRTVSDSYSKVRYIDPARFEAITPSFTVDTDGPVSVVPGRGGFEAHRLLGFVGGSEPHVSIYHPGESLGLMDRRMMGISSLGTCVSLVRRYNGVGTIMVAMVDRVEGKVSFNSLRDVSHRLPAQHIQPPSTVKSWLIPHLEGLIVLSYDGRRSIANSLPFPA